MSVLIHVLDRRLIRIVVAELYQRVGILRHLSRVTDIDDRKAEELKKATTLPTPTAVLVASVHEMRLAERPDVPVAAHPVIGWEEGRHSVTDSNWDYLPVLGYAVREPDSNKLFLYELKDDGLLHFIDYTRGEELRLTDNDGLIRRGQPVIVECHSVTPFIPNFVEADCVLEDGRRDRLLVRIENGNVPDPSWLVGRKPRDAEVYAPGR
jgi:hypothetical protein